MMPWISDEVCSYAIYRGANHPMPFKVVLLNNKTGAAKIVLKEDYQLDYEKRHKYRFEIAPRDCRTGKHAHR